VNLSICDHQIVRNEWGVLPGQKVFLSFGYVRDGKNIDLAIKALKQVPQAFLVIVGSVASTKDKPFQYYRDLAAEVGVEERCRFFEGFISDEELGRYFSAADCMASKMQCSACSSASADSGQTKPNGPFFPN